MYGNHSPLQFHGLHRQELESTKLQPEIICLSLDKYFTHF